MCFYFSETQRLAEEEAARTGKVADHQTLAEMIVSCRSLSYYEGTSIKTALPQVSIRYGRGFRIVIDDFCDCRF